MIITHDPLDHHTAIPPGHGISAFRPRHWTSLYRVPMVVTSGGQDWRLVQTCTLEDLLLLVLTSGGYWEVCILLESFLVGNIFSRGSCTAEVEFEFST